MNIEEGKPALSSGEAVPPLAPTHPGGPVIEERPQVAIQLSELEPGFYRVDPRSIKCDYIGSSIGALILTVILVVGTIIAYFAIDVPVVVWIMAGCCTAFLLWIWLMAFLWPPLDYKYACWKLDDSGMEIRKGVLWRHRISVPLARVQHVDVSQGPLQRQFGLAELTIHTAGTQNASVKLEGLAHPVALQLRDDLISMRERQDGV